MKNCLAPTVDEIQSALLVKNTPLYMTFCLNRSQTKDIFDFLYISKLDINHVKLRTYECVFKYIFFKYHYTMPLFTHLNSIFALEWKKIIYLIWDRRDLSNFHKRILSTKNNCLDFFRQYKVKTTLSKTRAAELFVI